MGHSIPVFLVPINQNELPEKMEHWNDAENLLGEKYNNKEENKLYSITSRNWWIQHAISLICTDLGIIGIEFIMKEIVYIPKGELDNVEKAINKLIKVIHNGIPELSSESEKTGTIYGLRKYFKKGKEYVFSKNDFHNAYETAKIVDELNAAGSGYQSVIDFFSAIKLYQSICAFCIQNDRGLLIVQPQP